MSGEIGRFALVGIANTLIGLAVIFAAKGLVGAGDIAANATGYGVGLVVSFLLNRSWTFSHDGEMLAAALRFLAAFAVGYAMNLATVLGLVHALGINAYLAQVLGVPPYAMTFFLLSKHFAFRRNSPQ